MGSSAQVDALKATKMIPPPPATTDAGNSPIDAVDGRFHDSHEFVVRIDSVTGVSAVDYAKVPHFIATINQPLIIDPILIDSILIDY